MNQWNQGDKTKQQIFRAKNKQGYKYSAKYLCQEKGDEVVLVLKANGKVIVAAEDIFDVIYDAHHHVSHKKVASTKLLIDKTYASITEHHIRLFINHCCLVCNLSKKKLKLAKGAANPIVSTQFRARILADLIDYRHDPREDINGVLMHYVLVIKDHFTKMIWLRPIQRKKAKYVAHALELLFSDIGWPLIFHTDNGNEFVAQVVEDMLAKEPLVCTVTGRPRKPQDQGSVERANRDVKIAIDNEIETARLKGISNPSWLDFLPRVTSSLNNTCCYGNYNITPYSHVFGVDYDCPVFDIPLSHMGKLKTVDDLIKYGDESMKKSLNTMGYSLEKVVQQKANRVTQVIDKLEAFKGDKRLSATAVEKEDIDDREDGQIDEDEQEDDDEQYEQEDDDDEQYEQEEDADKKEGPEDPQQRLGYEEQEQQEEYSFRDDSNYDDECMSTGKEEQGKHLARKLAYSKFNPEIKDNHSDSDSDDEVLVVTAAKDYKQKIHKKKIQRPALQTLAMESGNIYKSRVGMNLFDFVSADINCSLCHNNCHTDICNVAVGEDSYYQYCVTNGSHWLEIHFLLLFGLLNIHAIHRNDVMLHECLTPNQYLEDTTHQTIPSSIKRLLAICHSNDHYAVLEFDIEDNHVYVFDGLFLPLNTWSSHIRHVLNKSQLGHPLDWDVSHVKSIMNNKLVQNDGYNCGAIACMVLWYRIRPNGLCHDIWRQPVSMFRHHIVNELLKLLHSEQNKDFLVTRTRMRSTTTNTVDLVNNDTLMCKFVKRREVLSCVNDRRKRIQEQSHEKMKRLRGSCVSVKPGNLVNVTVPMKDKARNKSLNLLAVVISVNERTKVITAATEHGIISCKKKRNRNTTFEPLHLSPDSYIVLEDLPSISVSLATVKDKIISGTLDLTQLTMISMSKAHELAYGGIDKHISEIKLGRNQCRCKSKCNNRRCKCLKNGLGCSSKCGCGGTCGTDE
jgi:hypothetical protein